MVFSSPLFLFLFLPLVLLATFLFKELKAKNTVLVIASLFFYTWGETIFTLIMLASILFNYYFGKWVQADDRNSAKRSLILAMVFNVGLLVVFKYANFVVDNLNLLLPDLGLDPIVLEPVHLPIGISFFTFQGMSYVIDVYRGNAHAFRKPGQVALYISLFPQLIAGPIIRFREISEQITKRTTSASDVAMGARRFIIGLSKKLLIADQVAPVVDAIFNLNTDQLPPSVAWLGIGAYAVQIYFDFSGYSDMAIGIGRMLGFRFPENFNFPYTAKSIREFWTRWHITLSNWFRDYLYISLGGNRNGKVRTLRNLTIVFLLTGLWHGASWNFVVWGMIHGTFMVVERSGFDNMLKRLPGIVSNLYVLLIVLVAWVFFRADDITIAWHYVKSMFALNSTISPNYYPQLFLTNNVIIVLLIALGSSSVLMRKATRHFMYGPSNNVRTGMMQTVGYTSLLLLCAMTMASSTYDPFIYFRF
jgi:alginate O-acetyltransferase complex protein AlgI